MTKVLGADLVDGDDHLLVLVLLGGCRRVLWSLLDPLSRLQVTQLPPELLPRVVVICAELCVLAVGGEEQALVFFVRVYI